MSQSKVKDVTLSLKTIDHLFMAPEANPFAEEEVELLGEPALLRVMKKMEPGFFRRGGKVRLTILLPRPTYARLAGTGRRRHSPLLSGPYRRQPASDPANGLGRLAGIAVWFGFSGCEYGAVRYVQQPGAHLHSRRVE